MTENLFSGILDILPQKQCQKCGYENCADYARAVAENAAPINRCPPGGAVGIERLAALTGRPVEPLDPSCGVEEPLCVAWIDENWCIGCTRCIAACPLDCILGAHKQMHTVIEDMCSGCGLCVPQCPVDCIASDVVGKAWSTADARAARERYAFVTARRARDRRDHEAHLETQARLKLAHLPELTKGATGAEAERKKQLIEAALQRVRLRRAEENALKDDASGAKKPHS